MPKTEERFKLVCLRTKEDFTRDGETVYYDNGTEAAMRAANLTRNLGEKYQPRRVVVDTNWMAREAKRFYDGTYFPVPWDSERWWRKSNADLRHFAHVSIEQDAMIAYTPNDEMGTADRQKRVSPGSYLTKYFGERLDRREIRDWVADFSVQYEGVKVKFAKTADQIEDVYLHGPNSCMSHNANDYLTKGFHPVRVYSGPDLAVAYLDSTNSVQTGFCCEDCEENGGCLEDNMDDGECDYAVSAYSARSVVWPKRKIYTRIYGDVQRLKLTLEKEGYKPGHIEGARLARHPIKFDGQDCFVVPYLDSVGRVRDDGIHLICDKNGAIDAQGGTNGLGFNDRPRCQGCNEPNDLQEVLTRRGNTTEQLCHTCLNGAELVRDYHHRVMARREHCIWFDDKGPMHMYYAVESSDPLIVLCSRTNVPIWRCDSVRMADGSWVSHEWFRSSGKYCHKCGNRGQPRKGAPLACGHSFCPADAVQTAQSASVTTSSPFSTFHISARVT